MMLRSLAVLTCTAALITGCGSEGRIAILPSYPVTGQPIAGLLQSGTDPVSGAHIYLLAANNVGSGGSSVSLLEAGSTGYADQLGSYVQSASDGTFTIPGYYVCDTNQQLYLYASGGGVGAGTNQALSEMGVLGPCSDSLTSRHVIVNEATTVAAAYALAGFGEDPLHISSGNTSLASQGLGNAFANASKLASITTGQAISKIPAGTAEVPQTLLNTLANILNACTSDEGILGSRCARLFSAAKGGSSPTDTATAIFNVVHEPSENVAELFALQSSMSPFQPALTEVPNDFSVGIVFTGGGLSGVTSMAIDESGNAWVLSGGGNAGSFLGGLTEISSSGAYLSGPNGYNVLLSAPDAMAIDTQGNIWVANHGADLTALSTVVEFSGSGSGFAEVAEFADDTLYLVRSMTFDSKGRLWMTGSARNNLIEMTAAGAFLSGLSGYTGGGLDFPVDLAFAPDGNSWIANDESFATSEFTDSGKPLSPASGVSPSDFEGGNAVAIDGQGQVWFSRQGGFAEVAKLSASGVLLSGPANYTGGGIAAFGGGITLAIDGDGSPWVPLYEGESVVHLSANGQVLSGPDGLRGGIMLFPSSIAIDGSGDVWLANDERAAPPAYYIDRVTELIGAAAPVVTPLAQAVQSSRLGSRP